MAELTPSRNVRAAPPGWTERVFARAPARLAAITLWILVGVAVLAPFVASQLPYHARVLDRTELESAARSIAPLARSYERLRLASDADYERERLPGSRSTRAEAVARERMALELRARVLERASGPGPRGVWGETLVTLRSGLALGDERRGAPLDLPALEELPRALASTRDADLRATSAWPLFASLETHSVLALLVWLACAPLVPWRRPRATPWRGFAVRIALAVLLACLWPLARPLDPHVDARTWKERLATPGARVESVTFAPLPFGFAETNAREAWRPPGWCAAAQSGAWSPAEGGARPGEPAWDARTRHLLGTDGLGRDVCARLLWGARTSLAVGLGAALLLACLGTLIGALAGTLGGKVDLVLSRVLEIVLCFPAFFLVLACASVADRSVLPPALLVALVIAGVGWTGVARLVRAECLRLRELDFVLAARAQGFSFARVLCVHVLPNALAPALVALSFAVGSAILTESALSFLGLGVEVPVPSWGALASETRNPAHWWLLVFPGLAVFATALAASVLGEALRDALDPRAHAAQGAEETRDG